MKIQELRLKNFRSFEDERIPFGPVTLVVGPNGAGKSTLQGALEFWASGKNTWAGTNEITTLIRHGAESAAVTVCPEGFGGEITRSIKPHGLYLTGSPAKMTLRDAQSRLEAVAGATADMARLSLRSSRFFDLPDKDQKALLYELLGLRITDEMVQKALEERDKDNPLPLITTAKSILKGPVTANFGAAHDRFRDKRTWVKKDLKKAQQDFTEAVDREEKGEIAFCRMPDKNLYRLAQERYEAAVAKREQALARLNLRQKVHGRLSKLQEQPAGSPEPIRKELQRYEDGIKKLEEELEEARALQAKRQEFLDQANNKLEEDRQAAREAQAEIDRANKRIEEELQAAREVQAKRNSCLERANKIRDEADRLKTSLEAPHATCPTCGGTVEAKERSQIEQRLEKLRGDWKVAKGEAPACQQPHIQALKSRLVDAEVQQIELDPATLAEAPECQQARIQELEGRLKKGRAYINTAREKLHQVDGHHRQLAEVEAQLAELPAEVDLVALEEEVAEAQAHQAEVELERREVQEWLDHCESKRQLEEKINYLELRRKALEDLVHWTGPEGFQREVLTGYLEPLKKSINDILGRWGMEADYKFPGVDLVVRKAPAAGWEPYHRLSDGEQILVALAYQTFFAVTTGFRIVVIDRIEQLDKDHQRTLFEVLPSLEDLVDHVLLLGVSVRVTSPNYVKCHQLKGVPAHV